MESKSKVIQKQNEGWIQKPKRKKPPKASHPWCFPDHRIKDRKDKGIIIE